MTNSVSGGKSAEAYRTISEVAESLKLPQHVLRFWETRFTQIKPMKRGGNRRYYRPEDVDLLAAIRQLLYGEGSTIKGVQRLLRENGPRAVAALAQAGVGLAAVDPASPHRPHIDGARPDGAWDGSGDAVGVLGSELDADHSRESRASDPEGAFPGDPVTRLRAVLASLAACRRILDAARA